MKDDFDIFELRLGIRYKLNNKIYGTQSIIVRMILKETLEDGAILLDFIRKQYRELGFKEGELTEDKTFKIQVLFHEIEPLIRYKVTSKYDFQVALDKFNVLNSLEKLDVILPDIDSSITSVDYENYGMHTKQEYILLYDSCKNFTTHQRLIARNSRYFERKYTLDFKEIWNDKLNK